MKKIAIAFLCAVFVGSVAALAACSDGDNTANAYPVNGGFESADLSGWTVEYGDAFDDDCVSSAKTFTYDGDPNYNEISVNATGNWYLCGKGFHGNYSGARTGALRSTEFAIPQDGYISMKLAGGALTVGKGSNAASKSSEKICYVGIYRSSDDRMIAMQTNEYFLEHTEDYVNAAKYAAGVYNTDNFYEYSLNLSAYAGEKAYIRIVDNDDSWYYGYISVDDIRIGEGAQPQTEGAFYTKVISYQTEAVAPSEYEIANGGFECGSLAGWTIVEGDAFSNEGVNSESVWWNENIAYNRDGSYHYGFYNPSATGVMRSTQFILGGSGYISWKLGGCSDNSKTYLRFMLVDQSGEDKEIARFSNFKYWNAQFPYVANGMRLLNMVQYYADFSAYLGETLYIEVVDDNSASDDLGCITLDSIQTYWQKKPVWYTSQSYLAVYDSDIAPESEYQVINGGFETGDLTGWTLSDESAPIGVVTSDAGWWNENFPYNKKGTYLFSGISHEGNTGTLTSSAFIVGGSGFITYLFGGGGNPDLCYISVIDADSGEELARYANRLFSDKGTGSLNVDSYLANMILYKADLSEFMGRSVKLQIVDNATADWGLITVDSFRTYYAEQSAVPSNANTAVDLLSIKALGEDNEYQVLNGDFETGDLRGWTLQGDIGKISRETVWWNENISFDKDGEYFFNGLQSETCVGTLTSSAFTVGGIGWMTFRLGGGKDVSLCRIEIIDAETEETLAAFGNTMFDNSDANFKKIVAGTASHPADAAASDCYMANMVLYKADLSEFMNRSVKIRIVDNATSDWGLITVDSFITYYESEADLPENAVVAQDVSSTAD